ncbi:MAG: glycosyltransferase family 4 protein [Acidobacteria bacterium]|nr:glycosyltransferase family 4 protein [Acidobacteriota bacterium]
MRIAQVSPLYESVPPRLYGGTERVVSWLTEALIDAGHEVTLFASGDSRTRARLVPACERALRLDERCALPLAHHMLQLEQVFSRLRDFDVVHFHADFLHFPLSRRHEFAHVTTLHGRLDIPDLAPLYDEYDDMPVVSISDAQRRPLPAAHWVGTVHHGLPPDLFRIGRGAGGYLAFLGRISPEKRADRAIEIARRIGMPLRIAAKVDRADQEYFAREIQPLLDDPLVDFVGEIHDGDKQEFLGEAAALLFPIDWPEPFGLVMIEALACGTPVVAYRHGSVAEIVEDGVSGFVVDDLDAAVRGTRRALELDRAACRAAFERRFTAARMARDYFAVYRNLTRATAPLRAVGD